MQTYFWNPWSTFDELAILELASADSMDRLAVVAGIVEAVDEIPTDTAPVRVLLPKLLERARYALEGWKQLQAQHPANGIA